jgi:hypothetical protein
VVPWQRLPVGAGGHQAPRPGGASWGVVGRHPARFRRHRNHSKKHAKIGDAPASTLTPDGPRRTCGLPLAWTVTAPTGARFPSRQGSRTNAWERLFGVGQGDTVRTPTVDVAADRGESSHAKKGIRGRRMRVGRREEEEERRNFTAPTMDQGWRASQLEAEVCLVAVRLPFACPRGSARRMGIPSVGAHHRAHRQAAKPRGGPGPALTAARGGWRREPFSGQSLPGGRPGRGVVFPRPPRHGRGPAEPSPVTLPERPTR